MTIQFCGVEGKDPNALYFNPFFLPGRESCRVFESSLPPPPPPPTLVRSSLILKAKLWLQTKEIRFNCQLFLSEIGYKLKDIYPIQRGSQLRQIATSRLLSFAKRCLLARSDLGGWGVEAGGYMRGKLL